MKEKLKNFWLYQRPSWTSMILIAVILLGIIFYLSGGISLHHSSSSNSKTIEENISQLQAAEAKTPTDFETREIQKKIELNEEAEKEKIIAMYGQEADNDELTSWYQDCMILGDSIVKAGEAYSWLNSNIVYGKIGASVSGAGELFDTAIANDPVVLFLSFGVNDITNYGSDVDTFINHYREAIQKVQAACPDTIIYVNAVFPAESSVASSKSCYQYLDQYNEQLSELCTELNINFINSNFILEELPELYDVDGLHPKSAFYPLWFTYLADEAGLTADAGSSDETTADGTEQSDEESSADTTTSDEETAETGETDGN